MMDATTGENERGARINALRDALQRDRLAGMFETADELAVKVVSALYRWQIEPSTATPLAPMPAAEPSGPAKVHEGYNLLWVPGSRLRVRFLNGPSLLPRRVSRVAQIWSAYANISFEPSDDRAAEVRVSSNEGQGSWSYEGTTCLTVDPKEQTVNFGCLRVDSAIDEIESVVLHEFGHVIGLAHEHNNPDAALAWEKETVYEQMGGPPNFWSKAQVDNLIFSTCPRNRFPSIKPFDPHSIMAFPVPGEFTEDGFSIGRNVMISAGDREFVSRLYPYADSAVAKEPSKNKPAGGTSISPPPTAGR